MDTYKYLEKLDKTNDLDENMIINVPDSIGEQINKIIQGQLDPSTLTLEICDNPKKIYSRKFLLKLNDKEIHPITVLDFPCIIEANKTIDYKTFYKSGDISQMLYVHEDKLKKEDDLINFNPMTDTIDPNFKRLIWNKDPDHKFKLKHGLSRCTRNIRKLRFNKKEIYDKDEVLEVAKKLKKIIDNGAANYENSIIESQNKTENESEIKDEKNDNNNLVNNKSKKKKIKINNNINNIEKTEESQKIQIPLDEDDDVYNNNSHIIKIDNDEIKLNINEKKNELINQYTVKKAEYLEIKKKLSDLEIKPKDLLKRKKELKKELKELRIKYKQEK
jgi:TATA-binding protein-associated factor Taf7